MTHYPRRYSAGTVSAVTRRGATRWVGTIKEGTVTEATDVDGHTLQHENGEPKLVVSWRTLKRTFSGIECAPYRYRGEVRHRGRQEAEEAFEEWRDSLVARAKEDAEAANAAEESRAKERRFSYANMGVADYMGMWLDECRARGLEASTVDGYAFNARRFTEFFGDRPVGEITEDDLIALDRALRERGLSGTSRNKAFVTFKNALRAHRRHIGTDPFDGFQIPAKDTKRPNAPTREDMERIKEDIAANPPTPFWCAVELALRTGMREGEVCGLRWRDVDEATGTIHVRHAIGRVNGSSGPHGCYVKGPKSNPRKGDATRTVPGSPAIKAALDRRRASVMDELRQAHPSATHAELAERLRALYVCGGLDGTFYNPAVLGRAWRGYSQALTGTARRPTFHDLRHGFCTQAIAAGVDPVTVAALVGHTDPGFTMRTYAVALDSAKEAAQRLMDEVI